MEIELVGVVDTVYEDLGPCTRVVIDNAGVGRFTFDVGDLPGDVEWWQNHIGAMVRILTRVEVVLEKGA